MVSFYFGGDTSTMILQEILSQIRILVPCPDLTDTDLVNKLNNIERQLFRQLPLPDKFYRFSSTPESPYYDLPDDCTEDRLENVVIDGEEYPKVKLDDDGPNRPFCTVILNKLYIHPNPTTAKDIYLYYLPRYGSLSASSLNAKPDLPEDYHELLVYSCAQWVAAVQRDIEMANNMQAEYEALLRDAKKYLRPVSPTNTTIKEWW